MKTKKLFSAALLAICAILIMGAYFLYNNIRFTDYQPAACKESTAEIANPYIGWYEIQNYTLSDTESFDLSKVHNMTHSSGLVLLEINLQNYAASPISSYALQSLDDLFSAWQSTGRQLILRFLYDWEGDAKSREPDNLEQILTHMTQTARVVNRYTDCIYILQGIFIGSWGEVHSSNYESDEQMLTLINHLDSVISDEIFLSVRTPKQWRTLSGSSKPLTAASAFNGSLTSRLGLFNDGMLGSGTDLDTYWDPNDPNSAALTGKLTREEELTFQNLLCTYVPNGGEVVIDNPYNDFDAAVKDLRTMHVSYLNRDYDQSVLSKWQASICMEDSPYNGMNGLDYIARHLGYRYVLKASDFSHPNHSDENAQLSITLENTGFSNCYRSFDVSVFLNHSDTRRTYKIPVQTDTRLYDSGTEVRLDIPLNIQDYITGTYDIYLKISDPVTDCEIRLANETEWHEQYGCPVGTLDLHIFPVFSK